MDRADEPPRWAALGFIDRTRVITLILAATCIPVGLGALAGAAGVILGVGVVSALIAVLAALDGGM